MCTQQASDKAQQLVWQEEQSALASRTCGKQWLLLVGLRCWLRSASTGQI